MSIKRAPSRVGYTVETFDPAASTVYSRSMPKPLTVVPLAPDLVYELPSSIYTIETNANEDLNLALQLTRLVADGSETPLDITGVTLDFIIRPRFDHVTLIKHLTNGAGIVIEDAPAGMITLYLAQYIVAGELLVSKSPADHWDYFFNSTVGGTVTELFRGPFVVHAGRYP